MAIDRRVQRTRTALYDALVRLIRRMPYGRISVEDILAEADVGRSTFYSHFRSKDELLDRSLERLKPILLASIAGGPGGADPSLWDCSRVLFEHVGEFRDIHARLAQGRGSEVLHAALGRVLSEVLRETLPSQTSNGMPRELAIQFVVASFSTVLAWWLDRHPEQTSEKAAALFRQLVGHGLEGAWDTGAKGMPATRYRATA